MSRSADREGRRKAQEGRSGPEGKWSMDEDFTEMDGGPIARLVAEIRDKRPNGDFTLTTEEARERLMNAFFEQRKTWLREDNSLSDENL
jgi:hypothetical protein